MSADAMLSWTTAALVGIAGMVEVGGFLCRTAIVAREFDPSAAAPDWRTELS
jgi:hypothetical protein